MKQILKNELSKKIHPDLVEELLREYEEIEEAFYLEDNSKLISSGKFVEIVFAILKNLKDNTLVDLNNIDISLIDKEISNLPKNPSGEEELLFLAIPRVAKSIQTIRSKKRIAHVKSLDPILQDRMLIKSAADWILSSFIFLFHTKSDKEIQGIIENIVQKKIPLIEEFEDGGMMILKKLTFIQKLLVILYKQRGLTTKKELKDLSNPKSPQDFTTNFNNLQKRLLIYTNGENVKINKNGIKEVEEKILKEK